MAPDVAAPDVAAAGATAAGATAAAATAAGAVGAAAASPERKRRRGLPTVRPEVFRLLTLVSLVFLGLIVVTGGAVRLTGSGLGCPTWPQCGDGSFTPHSQYALHGAVEFGNRMVSIVMGVFMLVTPLAALRLPDRRERRDLVWLSFGLLAGFLGQAVLGGITVLTDLHPATVAAHFLLSMLLLVDGVVLYRRARQGAGPVTVCVRRELLWLARVLVVVAAGVLVLGTVVTGTGPHSGDDEKARRFGFDIVTVAQLHADSAMLVTGLAVAMVFAVRIAKASPEARRWANALVVTIVAQAAIGFTQYFLGIPAGLVALHVAGATLMWIAALRLWLALADRPRQLGTPASDVVDVAAVIDSYDAHGTSTVVDAVEDPVGASPSGAVTA
jgi:cytochrome c oxidase assembly protein subunit 15